MRRTVSVRLDVPVESVLPLLLAHTAAYNFVCARGWKDKDSNGVSLHHKTYHETRQRFGLMADLAVSARIRATESLAAAKKRLQAHRFTSCPNSDLVPVRYASTNWNIWFDRNEVSFISLAGRRNFPAKIPSYVKQYASWRRTSAELAIRRGKVFLNICFEKENPSPEPSDVVVGIDRGLRNIAVSSDNRFFGGKKLKQTCHRIQRLRSKLQACGSRSAKRHLRRLSGKENRFRRNENHRVAKEIVARIPQGSTIALENLKSIRQRMNRGRRLNRDLHSWAFLQLEQFITYKAEAKSIRVELVDARYTSQKCSRCGHTEKDNRHGGLFHCLHCGFQLDADLNAARNIRANHLAANGCGERVAVNQPIVPIRKNKEQVL